MIDLARRNLLKAAALLPIVGALDAPVFAFADRTRAEPLVADLVVDRDRHGPQVHASLASLSYETLQLVNPAFFSATNRSLVSQFRELSPRGILRIGGNTSDYALWGGYSGKLPNSPYMRRKAHALFKIPVESVRELGGFLDATGWRLIFGLNLEVADPAMAVDLARAVKRSVGEHLLAVQIGNEQDVQEAGSGHGFASYGEFDTAWKTYAGPLREAGIPVGGPDTGAHTNWVLEYAKEHGRQSKFLSRHYYRGAAADATIRAMLAPDTGFYKQAAEIARAAKAVGVPFRLTEANSFYNGGRDGVSDAFASALWGADFMLALAQRGVASVHFHGGTKKALGASLTAVGASLVPAETTGSGQNLTQRRDKVAGYYSPIAGNVALGFQPRPLYYGMLLAQRFAGARMVHCDLNARGANVTAYAANRDRVLKLALINKDMHHDVKVDIHGLAGHTGGTLTRLQAPSLASRSGVSLANAGYLETDDAGHGSIVVPRGSAVFVHCDRAWGSRQSPSTR